MNEKYSGILRPEVTVSDAEEFVRTTFAINGVASELGSQQDRNFLVTTSVGERYLFKVSNSTVTRLELEAQNEAMASVESVGVATPVVIRSSDGATIVTLDIDGTELYARLATFVDGVPLIEFDEQGASLFAAWGQLVGTVSKALVNLKHPGLERELQWDLRNGVGVVQELSRFVKDEQKRELLVRVVERAHDILEPLSRTLPLQPVHGDLTDDNVVCSLNHPGIPSLAGVIDYGDASMSWRVGELAIACAAAFHYQPGWPLEVLAVIESFDVEVPLHDDEIEALWPLIVLRGATLVVSGEQQVVIDPENHYAQSAREREWLSFKVPAEFDWSVATEAIRLRLGRERSVHPGTRFEHSMLPGLVRSNVIDLGCTSRSLSNGAWLTQPLEEESRLLRAALSDVHAATTRFGESRLTRSRALDKSEPINVALAIDVLVHDRPSTVLAPFGGEATIIANAFVLVGETHTVFIEGMLRPRVGAVLSGETIGETLETFTVWLATNDRNLDVTNVPPHFVRRSQFLAWTRRFEDPTAVVGVSSSALELPSPTLGLSRRSASYHPLQSHYYADPPQIERGWREHLIDVDARHYLDMVNNVTVLGHGHPRIAEAAADQWRMLNTNSRFHYDAVTELSERLLSTLPPSFDSVLLVNSGTEAVDLALRLTKAFSGREDVMCVTESYHGWSLAADAVSTSVSDNPRATETRPSWAHATATPNAYRGRHRGPGAGQAYASDTINETRQHAREGRPIGTFIIEPRGGNAGAIEVPPLYLSTVFTEIRSGGGVCISDETQVGYGRQGDVFWGYQQHPGVVPDVITIAKAMGNGHPLGAVITRKEIVDALSSQGTFFSSAGGSTLSCRIGIEVLDCMKREGLQANALMVGNYLRDRLQELAQQHHLIGAVHGRGLYLGIELVRDRTTLEPAVRETGVLCDRLRQLGVIVQPTGDRQNVLKAKPPLCFTFASADFFVEALDEALARG